MATDKDILEELLAQTQQDNLTWRPHDGFWLCQRGQCTFTLFTKPANLDFAYRTVKEQAQQSINIPDSPALQDLRELVQKKFPYPRDSRDESLRRALECLKDR